MKAQLIGQRFERLTVTASVGSDHRGAIWRCLCDCGRESIVPTRSLRDGNTRSCGCLRDEARRMSANKNSKHGHAANDVKSASYSSWNSMHSRCTSHARRAERYAERGIRVCERWSDFANFLLDMGERPPGTTLDRIDNDGDYEPSNCRWADWKTQQNNRGNNRRIEHNGERLTLSQWADRFGMPAHRLKSRLKAGWPIVHALNAPKSTRLTTAH